MASCLAGNVRLQKRHVRFGELDDFPLSGLNALATRGVTTRLSAPSLRFMRIARPPKRDAQHRAFAKPKSASTIPHVRTPHVGRRHT